MVALSFAARHVEPGSGDYWCWRAFADRCPMQDSNPQADGNAEARSRDVTSGGLIGVLTPCCATGRGYRLRRTAQGQRACWKRGGGGGGGVWWRRGVGGKIFLKCAPPTGPAPTPKDAPPDQTNECAEPGVTPSRYRNRAKLSAPPRQSSPRERL